MPAERSGKIKENYEWKVRQSSATWLLALFTLNSNAIELEQIVHSHRTWCYRSGWLRGCGKLNTNPLCFLLSRSQSSFLLIHSRYGPNTC